MKKLATMLLAVAVLVAAPLAFAEPIKVGVVDLPKVLQKSPKVAAINKKLQQQFMPQQQKIVALQNKLRDAAKAKASKDQMSADQSQLQKMAAQFQQSISDAQATAMQSLISDVNATVKTIAEEQKLDVVLLKPAVLYANNPIDITDQVIAQMPK